MEGLQVYGDGTCAVCGTACQVGTLMCRTHYRQIPRDIKNNLFDVWQRWLNGGDLGDLRAVQNAAVAAVTGRDAHAPTLLGPPEENTLP